jgi:hypothetical protein
VRYLKRKFWNICILARKDFITRNRENKIKFKHLKKIFNFNKLKKKLFNSAVISINTIIAFKSILYVSRYKVTIELLYSR